MKQFSDRDWAQAVASAVAARSPLTSGSAHQIEQTFAAARDLRICLIAGEGRYGELEAYTLLRNGAAEARPLAPEPLICSAPELAAAQRALQDNRIVSVTMAPGVDSNVPVDGQCPATWLLAAPLTPTNSGSRTSRSRALGVVLVSGHGREATVDAQWLQDWAAEMAGLIQHASVQLMESSLDMLAVIFPPRVLEQLVANAARKAGQMDLAAVLRSSSMSPTSGMPTAPPIFSGPSSVRTSLEGLPPVPPAGGVSSSRSSLEEAPLLPAGPPLREGGWPAPGAAAADAGLDAGHGSPSVSSGRGYAGASPFAAAAGAYSGAAVSVSPGNTSPTPLSLSLSTAQMLRHASHGSSASALLRQVSKQSGLGLPFVRDGTSDVPLSPSSQADMSGFEDILADDHRRSLERRPSMAPERARSQSLTSWDASTEADTAAMEETEAGGLPAAVHAAEARVTEQQGQQQEPEPGALFDQRRHRGQGAAGTASAGSMFSGSSPFAAAARASSDPLPARPGDGADRLPLPARAAHLSPLTVHVPWQKKPLINPLTSSDARGKEEPLLSPRKPSVESVASPFGSNFGGSSCIASGAGSVFSVPSADIPIGHVDRGQPAQPSLGSAGLGSIGSAASSAQARAGSARPPASSARPPASSAATRQSWDLSFASPALEASYRRWLAPYLLRSDTWLGLVHFVTAATLAAALVGQGRLGCCPRSLLTLAGLLIMSASTLPAWLHTPWWPAWRSPILSLARVLATLLFAVHSVLAAADVAGGAQAPSPWAEQVLVGSGTAALALLPIRFPLAFSLHLPLHLLCLWLLTAASSLAHVLSGGTTPIGKIIFAQLLLGFLLSSAVSYRREYCLRASFLKSRRACMNGRGKRRPLPLVAG